MNFLLNNIEQEIGEQYLLEGEELLGEGQVGPLREPERNLWVARVGDVEVEIHITPSKVRACSCECKTYLAGGMCGHIAAGLLALRKTLASKKEARPRVGGQGDRYYQKLTTASILQNIDLESLANFVAEYAKTNRNFALALKARFASAVPMHDSREKYAQLLDTSIQAYRKQDDRISASGAVQLLKAVQQLLGQAEDATAMAHYSECWAILQGILSKIPPLLRKLEGEEDKFKAHVASALRKMEALISKPLPPMLREEIWSLLLEECTRPAYRIHGFSKQLFAVLEGLADDDDKARQFLQILDNELQRKVLPTPYHKQVLFAKMALLKKPGLQQQADEFLLDCLASPDRLLLAVETAMDNGRPEMVKDLAGKGLRFVVNEEARMKLESVLLAVSMSENDPDRIVGNARQLFLETLDLAYFRLCRQHVVGPWDAFFSQLEIELWQRGTPLETMAALFAEDQRYSALTDVLEKAGSLDLLGQYSHLLVEGHADSLLSLYIKLLDGYLSNHLGIVPSRRVQAIIAHLYQIGAAAAAEGLIAFLKEKYPVRLVPIEEEGVS